MAVHTIVLVIMMGLFAFVGMFLFYKWSDTTSIQASLASCKLKIVSYCTDWKVNNYADKPWNWNEKNPLGCERFDVKEPTSKQDCEPLQT